jgi:hypothetical protein
MVSVWIAMILLLGIVVYEIWKPQWVSEGFTSLVSVGGSSFWQKWMPRRGDVSIDPTGEPDGYTRDIRYFAGFTDVQRLGQNHDFCRMVSPSATSHDGVNKDMFFACALGGTEGLSSVKYRTKSVADGFEVSRDDYMNAGYCRILKRGDDFQPMCNPIGDTSFKDLVVDPTPPPAIQTLLSFYEGIVFWLRFKDSLEDYAKNLTVSVAGGMEIDEVPRDTTDGLEFNGVDQFLRIGDDTNLEFSDVVQLRYLRGVSFWVYFEEFTNNAKIFDFGNGPNQDNVFVGIVGRGNSGTQQEEPPKSCVDESIKTVPDQPSGAQCVTEVSPQVAFATSRANIETYDCPSPDLFGRIMEPNEQKAGKPHDASTADLLYEIFEGKMRKLHVQVKNVFPIRKWTHIVITTTNNSAFSSGLKIYANGKLVHTEESAFLPQTNYTTTNYIGKSNWANTTSQYANADELFKGKLFDFRGYRTAFTEQKIKDTYEWGQTLLGQIEKE